MYAFLNILNINSITNDLADAVAIKQTEMVDRKEGISKHWPFCHFYSDT